MRFPTANYIIGESDVPSKVSGAVKDVERPLLEASELTTRFEIRSGTFKAVAHWVHTAENLSFGVRAGKTLALVGEG